MFKVREAASNRQLPEVIIKRLDRRMKYVTEGVARVEKGSGLKYPPYYVEPVLPVAASSVEYGQLGVMYARTLPLEVGSGVEILVQLSVPLVLYGLKSTLHAVLAHEFMHYVEFVRKFTGLHVVSDPASSSLFESVYTDYGRLYDPKLLFKDRFLVRLIAERFQKGFFDEKLQQKTLKQWLEKGLPAVKLAPESNVLKLPLSAILNARFDPQLRMKLDEIDKLSLR